MTVADLAAGFALARRRTNQLNVVETLSQVILQRLVYIAHLAEV